MTTKYPKCFVFAFAAGILGKTEASGILNPAKGQRFTYLSSTGMPIAMAGVCPTTLPGGD
jgi:hypothetical protein